MKRLYYQEKLYDYSSMEEFEKHIAEMKEKGWKAKAQKIDNDGRVWYVYENGQAKYPYSAVFYKEKL